MNASRVHLAPAGTRAYLAEAIRAGGGSVVNAGDANAVVWTDGADAKGLACLLRQYPTIRWVQLATSGIESFHEAGLLDRGRVWTSAKGVCATFVAEHALSLALAGLRRLHCFSTARRWAPEGGTNLFGRCVTIFGGGHVAQALISLLGPFQCRITVVRRAPAPIAGVARIVGWEERLDALDDADVVVLALALTPQTRGIIGRDELRRMQPGAWLVNVARGAHVVTERLVESLSAGWIGGAALDVTDPEPLPDGHPLWSLPNCIITPHTANTAAMEQALLSRRIADNVKTFANGGGLMGRIDPDAGY